MTFAAVRKLALALPGVAEGTSYGLASLKLRGKFFTRHRPEDDSFVIGVGSFEERDFLLKANDAR